MLPFEIGNNENKTKPAANEGILVLCEDYPNEGRKSLMYVHTRNKYYIENGIKVVVLCFKTKIEYIYEGIRVIPYRTYQMNPFCCKKLILHAANIRNHFRFIWKYGNKFSEYIFFFHGHEVLDVNKTYPKPYDFARNGIVRRTVQSVYDKFKLKVWGKYIPKIIEKSYFIFVSNWMREEFLKWTKINESIIRNKSSIIYNCVSEEFENNSYDDKKDKEFDFITIRSNLDASKYAIDIVAKIAEQNRSKRFLLIGRGEFFRHNEKPLNITWIDTTLKHSEIMYYLNRAKYALMPTRTDAQGLMMCEMAAYGIPVITSNISVCHEVFDGFSNAFFIDNNSPNIDLIGLKKSVCCKDKRFFKNNTIRKEVELLTE